MGTLLIRNATLVNEGQTSKQDVFIDNDKIVAMGESLSHDADEVIEAEGLHLLPGVIDGQVHFREPGFTHKADIASESRAAIAGGVTSFFDMPNTKPNVLTLDIQQEKYNLADGRSWANYAFLLGVNGENVDEIIQMDLSDHLAITDDGLYFSGKGNLLADNPDILEKLFANCDAIIAIHSEKESLIIENEEKFRAEYGDDVPVKFHPIIRSEQACFEATERAIGLAQKHNARLHILHLTTAKEAQLFRNDIPLKNKRITTEVSVHHLWFCDKDYERLGKRIKWNPAIKTAADRDGLLQALLEDRIDIITTDHAPHAWEEKDKPYFQSMSGAPLVQHALVALLEFYHQGKISLEKIVEKMCHAPAELYAINKRGYVREGYFADLTLVDLNHPWTVGSDNILYKCGWSPLEGTTFQSQVQHTIVNGNWVYRQGEFAGQPSGVAIEKAP